MPMPLALVAMNVAEPILVLALAIVFFNKRLNRRFPFMGIYLALRAVVTVALAAILFAPFGSDPARRYACYFYPYWIHYLASAILQVFVCVELFQNAMRPLPGLARLGAVAFRWAGVVSVILTLGSAASYRVGSVPLSYIAVEIMHSVSMIEFILLAFLALSMNALQLPVGSRSFGISLGLGMLAANDFLYTALFPRSSLGSTSMLFFQGMVLVSLLVWMIYCFLPEPERKRITLPVNSTIYRWNEIASALGHKGTQVAVQPASSFFLTDVEKVVEKVLTRASAKSKQSPS